MQILSKHPFATRHLPLVAAVLFGAMVAVSARPALAVDARNSSNLWTRPR